MQYEIKDLKLCYVSNNVAYFTTKELPEQWGDDWDDIPYEHNAEEPYDDKDGEHKIVKIKFYADLDTPCEGHFNSPYSVKSINAKATPWLCSSRDAEHSIKIFAGVGVIEFINKVQQVGDVYYPLKWLSSETLFEVLNNRLK